MLIMTECFCLKRAVYNEVFQRQKSSGSLIDQAIGCQVPLKVFLKFFKTYSYFFVDFLLLFIFSKNEKFSKCHVLSSCFFNYKQSSRLHFPANHVFFSRSDALMKVSSYVPSFNKAISVLHSY